MGRDALGHWTFTSAHIADIREWQRANRLELQPDFQRKEVWNQGARVVLMDTILRDIPMPKIFLWCEIVNDDLHRRVIDGQQRIRAILAFLEDKFPLEPPYEGPHLGKKFSELPKKIRDKFLQYQIDINIANNVSEAEVRDVYSRVNKYTIPLTKQELRAADFPGDFLNLCTQLAENEFFDDNRVFSFAKRQRMGDVEFVSEIISGLIRGPQNKKEDLDYFYMNYKRWPASDSKKIEGIFNAAIDDISIIFSENDGFSLRKTRFRQKSDFYTLFLSVAELKSQGHSLKDKDLGPLRGDLKLMDRHIAPESSISVFSEYAIKCVSQANTQGSRAWRKEFITNILSGTYKRKRPSGVAAETFASIRLDLGHYDLKQLKMFEEVCPSCRGDITAHENIVLEWAPEDTVFQISNSRWRGLECANAKS